MAADDSREDRPEDVISAVRPQWRRPNLSVLDVESGTITTSGPVADGNGSTS